MVISAPSLASFERRLDKFWENQKIKYDFKKCLKITHPNNTPFTNLDDGSEEEFNEEDLPIEV